jgi:hypothetical protein
MLILLTAVLLRDRLRRPVMTEPVCRQIRQLSGSEEGLGQNRAQPGYRKQAGRWRRGPGRHTVISRETGGNGEQDQRLTAAVTATAATGKHQRPATAHNSRTMCVNWGCARHSLAEGRRAISQRDQRPGRTIVAVVVALGLDVEADRIGDPVISAACLMLIDQRGACALSWPIRVIRSLRAAPLFTANWLPACRRS